MPDEQTPQHEQSSLGSAIMNALNLGSQLSALADAVLKMVETRYKVPDIVKQNRELQALSNALANIQQRLFYRYIMLSALEEFAVRGGHQRFKHAKETVTQQSQLISDRFLGKTDDDAVNNLKSMNPKLASDLLALTKGSLELYDYFLQQRDVDTARAVAATIASIGRHIAKYLENVEDQMKMLEFKIRAKRHKEEHR
jgi:hypothetical protein